MLFGFLRAQSGSINIPYVEYAVTPLENIRDAFVGNIIRTLPEPHASYISGVLVGVKSNIPYDLKDAFRRSGTAHILALSGYNVTIIARTLERIIPSIWFSGSFIFLFVIATGAASSLVRAAIMGGIVLLAKSEKREYSAPHALAVAVLIMLVFDPGLLLGDIGFQLSVAATLGLIYFERPIGAHLQFMPKVFGFRDALISTLAAEIATLPLVLWYFGFFSPFAPVVNMLVLPTVPAVMFVGFLVGVFGFASPMLATMIAWPVYLLSTYQITLIKFFASISIF